jgi:hypothetical protein
VDPSDSFRIVQFRVLANHLHLVCESCARLMARSARTAKPCIPRARASPVVPARTWLASTGWRRWGPLRLDEMPTA